MPYEFEKKYIIQILDREKVIKFCTDILRIEPTSLNLTDYRFNISENKFGGYDFERLRISKNLDSEEFILGKKFTDEKNQRHEEEKIITQEEANKVVRDTSGKLIHKKRLDWHGILEIDSLTINNFSFVLDEVDIYPGILFWELEIMSADAKMEDIYYSIIESIINKSNINFQIAERSMLQMSDNFICKSLSDLQN